MAILYRCYLPNAVVDLHKTIFFLDAVIGKTIRIGQRSLLRLWKRKTVYPLCKHTHAVGFVVGLKKILVIFNAPGPDFRGDASGF